MNVVQGNIKGSSDKISINFSDKEKTVSKSTVRDVKEDKIYNQIRDISEKGIDLKEVGYGVEGFGKSKTIYTNGDCDQLGEEIESQDGLNREKQQEKESAEGIGRRLTAKDYEQLMTEGDIQEAYDVIRLDKALTRIKSQRQDRREGIEKQAKEYAQDQEEINQIAYNTHSREKTKQDVSKLLEEANLPVTEDSITKVAMAIELSNRLDNLSDNDISYMIKNNLVPTLANLYKSSYSNMYEDVSPLSDEEKAQLRLQIQTILVEAGYEVSVENEEKAIWLIEHNIPLNKETFGSLNQLYDINGAMKKADYQAHIIEKIIGAVESGIAPEDTIISVVPNEIIQALETIKDSYDNTVKVALQLEEPITISTLAKANEYLRQNGHIEPRVEDGKYISAKRQLEEIRLKMTADVAGKMTDKGIRLDTTELSLIVEELKNMENTYYSNLLKEGDVISTPENILLLQDITKAMEDIKFLPNYSLGVTLRQRDVATLSLIKEEGRVLKSLLEHANESYETLMTAPRRDLGDSINKAFAYTDAMLLDMELEATRGNQRAVRILAYNNMEITKESIQDIKMYDTMVNQIFRNMHPAVVVDMIKEGSNPLDIPLDELSKNIELRKEELGVSEEERYSTYLWKLEREEGITPEERKSYIGIYRLINNVEKTDGAAIGSVIKADQEITLNNLLTAVRTIKNQGMNVEIDDTFGALEELTYSRENITSQIDAGYKQSQTNELDGIAQQVDYIETLLSNIMEDISPSKLSSVTEAMNTDSNEILELSVERFYEELQVATEDKELSNMYQREQVDQIRETLDSVEGPLTLLKNLNMPATIAHIAVAKEYLYQGTKTYNKLYEIMDYVGDEDMNEGIIDSMNNIVDSLTDEESLKKEYEMLSKKANTLVDKALEIPDIRYSEIMKLKSINQGMKLATALSNIRQYEIPILVGDKITNVNLKVIMGQGKTSKVDIKVQSESLGNIDSSFTVKAEEMKGLILCDNREGLSKLKNNQEALIDNIHKIGLTLKQLDYGNYHYSKNTTNIELDEDIVVKNSDSHTLYEVAKLLIYHIKDVELQNI